MNVDPESEDSVSEKIQPALSEQEWAAALAHRYGTADYAQGITEYAIRAVQHISGDEKRRPHVVAALCLHGEPFGFTWEDVATIRANCDGFQYVARTTGANLDGEVDKLLNIADRIAALLPPRESGEGAS